MRLDRPRFELVYVRAEVACYVRRGRMRNRADTALHSQRLQGGGLHSVRPERFDHMNNYTSSRAYIHSLNLSLLVPTAQTGQC